MKIVRSLIVLLLCTLSAAAQKDSPAWQAARKFMRGVNIANCLEVPPGEHWFVPHSVLDLQEIRTQGFDHVRLPVGWHNYTGPAPDYKLSNEIFAKVDALVTNATALGLNIIINIHNFNEFMKDPTANTDRFYAIWRQVAAHYAKAQDGVVFELLNEPHDAATTAVMNPIDAETIRIIRQTNPHRAIFIEPGNWGSPNELANLELPKDDNIIVSVHCYDPMFFTHQGASWAGPAFKATGIHFPGPPMTPFEPDPDLDLPKWILNTFRQYNTEPTENNPSSPKAFLPKIEKAKAWSEEHGIPIHFGEFGAFTKADQPSRARFYAAMRRAFDANGLGWAIWDWKSGFNYWNPKTQQPLPGMREALFSKTR